MTDSNTLVNGRHSTQPQPLSERYEEIRVAEAAELAAMHAWHAEKLRKREANPVKPDTALEAADAVRQTARMLRARKRMAKAHADAVACGLVAPETVRAANTVATNTIASAMREQAQRMLEEALRLTRDE